MKKKPSTNSTSIAYSLCAILVTCLMLLPFVSMAQCYGPGGDCTQLKMWLRADSGISAPVNGMNVSVYRDQSLTGITGFTGSTSTVGSTYTVTQPVVASQPKWYSGSSSHAINYNPVLSFDGVDDFFATNRNTFLTAGGFTGSNALPVVFAVGRSNSYANTQVIVGGGVAANNLVFGLKNGSGAPYTGYFANDSLTGSTIPVNTSFMHGFNRLSNGGQRPFNLMTNGLYGSNKKIPMPLAPTQAYTTGSSGGNWELGRNQHANTVFNGDIAEVFVYNLNSNTTGTQLARKATYLAVKYGFTLDTIYLNSVSAVVWNPAVEPSYHNDVVGIAREASENLLQKQSHTTDDSLRIYVGSLAADNAANTGVFTSDKAYVMIGSNKGALYATPAVATEKPAGIYARIEREWKLHNTNWGNATKTDGTFNIEIKLDGLAGPLMASNMADLRLLVSASPDMTQAVVYAPGDEGINFSLGSVIISGITTYHGGLPGMGVWGLGGAIPNDSVRYITLGSASGATPLVIFGLLPYNPVSFNAAIINETAVCIQWQTSGEQNHDQYQVEKSVNGSNWELVGPAKTNSDAAKEHHYRVMDDKPYTGISYYRLLLKEASGNQRYSAFKTIQFDRQSLRSVSVYPNPVVTLLTIEAAAAELDKVNIFSCTGQDVTSLTKITKRRAAGLVLDVSKLNPGIYIIKTNSTIVKMLKQ